VVGFDKKASSGAISTGKGAIGLRGLVSSVMYVGDSSFETLLESERVLGE